MKMALLLRQDAAGFIRVLFKRLAKDIIAQCVLAATAGEKELDFGRPPIYLRGGRKRFCMTEHRKNPVERKGKSS